MPRSHYFIPQHEYCVVRDGFFYGYMPGAWKDEYPDAQIFHSLPEAIRVAQRYSGARVVRDYGMENQTEVY